MNNVLLTGSNGFIGKYFLHKYSEKYNIKTFSFLNDDFKSLHVEGVEVIVHLSALVHQMGGAAQEEYERVNVTQSIELAKKAKASGVKQFVFMSSVKVYGEETNVPYSEESECKPQGAYGKSKLKAEHALLKLEDENFKVAIIRTPIVYGFEVKANIKNLVRLVQKVPILPFGEIENRRSMIYVGNLSYFIDLIITKQSNGIFLVADTEPVSTTGLIEIIATELHKKVYLVKIPFFESLLRLVKPSFYKRLFESLEIDNQYTLKRLFDEVKISLPYSVKDGIRFMIRGEDR